MHYVNQFPSIFWSTVGVAILCGIIIGIERQLRGKPAGIRTSCLICLGTAIFMRLGADITDGGNADPSRVLGQLITGVGFLGGGVILAREGVVTGVTTAAVIWVLAAIGATIGYGHFLSAIVLSIITVAILTGIELLESGTKIFRRGVHMHEKRKDKDNEIF